MRMFCICFVVGRAGPGPVPPAGLPAGVVVVTPVVVVVKGVGVGPVVGVWRGRWVGMVGARIGVDDVVGFVVLLFRR